MRIADTILQGNIEEVSNIIRMKEVMGLPQLIRFSDNLGYQKLSKLNEMTKDKEVLIKILREFSQFSDYTEEDIHNSKLRKFILCFQEQAPIILKIIRKFISEIHQLKEVIPNFDESKKEDLVKCFHVVSRYKKETFLEILSFINNKKVIKAILENKNRKQIILEIEKIKQSIQKKRETIAYKKEYGPNYKEFLDAKRKNLLVNYTYVPNMMFDELEFIKDKIKASFWGEETKCCLKKGGAAKDLLIPIEQSPIAGEIVGKLRGNKMSSYTWDMIEFINGKAYKTLILDNIESPIMIDEKDTEYLFDRLHSFGKYKTIYLGTVRNDCTVSKKYKTRPRQNLLPGFDFVFRKSMFTHADSDVVYVMREHNEDNLMEVRKMNISDLHLCKYIEKYIYGNKIYNGEDDKTDILKQVLLDTPCYILDSTTNIFGYMLTKWKYFDKNGKELFNGKGSKKFYIEDLVVSKNKKAISKLSEIFEDLTKWLINNKINEVYLHTNKFSKNFKKRLEKLDIKVIEEDLGEVIEPINFLM